MVPCIVRWCCPRRSGEGWVVGGRTWLGAAVAEEGLWMVCGLVSMCKCVC